jgi:hypothetical protein
MNRQQKKQGKYRITLKSAYQHVASTFFLMISKNFRKDTLQCKVSARLKASRQKFACNYGFRSKKRRTIVFNIRLKT